jgi:hypothetical protein
MRNPPPLRDGDGVWAEKFKPRKPKGDFCVHKRTVATAQAHESNSYPHTKLTRQELSRKSNQNGATMKTHLYSVSITLALLANLHQAVAQGTAFTYQGRLGVGSNAANGTYDLKLSLYDAASSGNLIAGPLTT